MTCNKKEITMHDRFGIFKSSLGMVMSGILTIIFITSMVFLWEWRIKDCITIIHVTVT